MSKLTAIIVDDDAMVRKSMSILCSKSPSIELVKVFSGGLEALTYIKERRVDLILIDLDMPNLSGWETLELLPYKPHVIVVSSKKDQAIKGFQFDVFDFLPKPVSVAQFLKTTERLFSVAKKESKDYLFVKLEGEHVKVKFDAILFIKALGDYIQVYLENEKLTLHSTLKAFVAKLPEDSFITTHRSYVVNLNRIDRVLKEDVQIGEHEIPVSKLKMFSLKKRINL